MALVVVHGQLVAELQVLHAIGEGDSPGERVTVGAFHGTADSVEGEVDTILHGLVASFEIQAVLVAETIAYGLCQPVGLHTCQNLTQFVGVGHIEGHLGLCVLAAEESGHTLHLQLLSGIGEVIAGEVGNLQTHTSRIGDSHAATLGALGLDDDHTVSGF